MNIEQLQRFLVVADCLNFTTAAERLYIGQSTISRQIAALEHELGVILLIRGPRSVELTEAGKVLQREGGKLVQYMDELKEKVVEAGHGTSGKLRISTVPAYFPCLNDLCLQTRQEYPNLNLSLSYSKYVNVCQDLDLGSAEIAVTYSFLDPHNDAYGVIDLQPSQFYVLCRKGHWLAQYEEQGVYLDEIRDTDIVFGRNGLVLAHQQKPYYGEPPADVNAGDGSMEGSLLSLQASNSIMILPGCSAENNKHNLVQVPLMDEDLRHTVVMLYRKDETSLTVQRFLDLVRSYSRRTYNAQQKEASSNGQL